MPSGTVAPMASPRPAAIGIRVLGVPEVVYEDGSVEHPPPTEQALLTALALAGTRGRTPSWLRDNLWSRQSEKNAVSRSKARLRQFGINIPTPSRDGAYVLPLGPEVIDAQQFVFGVSALPVTPTPDQLETLLGLWRGNPWDTVQRVPELAWREVRRALTTVTDHLRDLPAEHLRRLPEWSRLQAIFAGNPDFADPRSAPVRQKVLIIDDQIGRQIADVLVGYETEIIQSLAELDARLARDESLDHDCALVDLHLTLNLDDGYGKIAISHLRRLRPQIPIVLMSAALPEEDWAEPAVLASRFGVDKVLHKHNDPLRTCEPIWQVVASLVVPRRDPPNSPPD